MKILRKSVYSHYLTKENIEGIYEITEEAEQFLKDNEVEK